MSLVALKRAAKDVRDKKAIEADLVASVGTYCDAAAAAGVAAKDVVANVIALARVEGKKLANQTEFKDYALAIIRAGVLDKVLPSKLLILKNASRQGQRGGSVETRKQRKSATDWLGKLAFVSDLPNPRFITSRAEDDEAEGEAEGEAAAAVRAEPVRALPVRAEPVRALRDEEAVIATEEPVIAAEEPVIAAERPPFDFDKAWNRFAAHDDSDGDDTTEKYDQDERDAANAAVPLYRDALRNVLVAAQYEPKAIIDDQPFFKDAVKAALISMYGYRTASMLDGVAFTFERMPDLETVEEQCEHISDFAEKIVSEGTPKA
jgi:hypothetical protein